MSMRKRRVRTSGPLGIGLLVLLAILSIPFAPSWAGLALNALRTQNVGGISVDASGVVAQPLMTDGRMFQELRQRALKPIPDDLSKFTPERRISLRQLSAAITEHRSDRVTPLRDEIRYLAGLQRVKYVLVYPEQGDIVLVGPAEGWKADRLGNIVGLTTGRPVLQLDNLIVALRTARSTNGVGISCSIDPTPEGIQTVRKVFRRLKKIGQPDVTMRRIEDAMGPQTITVTGVPANSCFARVMVAADVRMKRLAMNFEDAPIAGMPSFLEIMSTSRAGAKNTLPRWWLAADYEPLLTDDDRLSWEIRGQGVKCMTETDFVADDGTIQRGVDRGSKAARRWADTMTAKYEELADKDSVFAQLRNIMDLAVVGALIEKEGLLQRANLDLSQMLSTEPEETFNTPRQVASQVSFVKRGHNWIISASGGVQIFPWEIADRSETSDALRPVWEKTDVERLADRWWSN